jgi:hypothetical protein
VSIVPQRLNRKLTIPIIQAAMRVNNCGNAFVHQVISIRVGPRAPITPAAYAALAQQHSQSSDPDDRGTAAVHPPSLYV